jgi:hypothetical protein
LRLRNAVAEAMPSAISVFAGVRYRGMGDQSLMTAGS